MLLNTEELLAVANGDVEPERLPDVLDRLDDCPESAAALQVLVTLKANREETIEALREAAAADEVSYPPYGARSTSGISWATEGLRMAISIAIVGLIAVWAVGPILFTADPIQELAITEYVEPPTQAELAINGWVADVHRELIQHSYADAYSQLHYREPLYVLNRNEPYAALLAGITSYHLGEYELALSDLRAAYVVHQDEQDAWRFAMWYEANAMIQLGRPFQALHLLEELKSAPTDSAFQAEAQSLYTRLADRIGLAPLQ